MFPISPDSDSPQVRLPPPLIFLSCILLGWVTHHFHPVALVPDGFRWAGLILFSGVGVVLMGHCVTAFRREKTDLLPWKTTRALVFAGAYGYSRNPMYLSFLLIGAGIACGVNSLWILAMLVPFVVILQRTAIAKEEAYLERKFGDAYLSYKKRVRRWL